MNVPISSEDLLLVSTLNDEHKNAYNTIISRIQEGKNGAFFIDGPGGSGKTYLYHALITTVRSKGGIALATATSGVAASILLGGRTAHSRFKIPLDTEKFQTCNISKQSNLAELLRRAKLILWDEVSMAKRQAIEVLDLLLQDTNDSSSLFGGKIVVFGGDFRHVFPVVPRGGKEETIKASFVKSKIGDKIEKLQLKENMRATWDLSFSQFLLRVGNVTENVLLEDKIGITPSMLIPFEDDITSKCQLVDNIFPNLEQNAQEMKFMTNKAILTTKNDYVDELNEMLIADFLGDSNIYYSFDYIIDGTQQFQQVEFLNSLTPNGLPPHKLILKKNYPIILL